MHHTDDCFAARVKRVKPSATVSVNNKALQLKAAGHDIINLSVGEPDFDTPNFIKETAIEAIHQGHTKYTAVDGIPELKQAIITKLARDNQLEYTPEAIIASNGVKQGLYNLTQAIIDTDDEVIIPAPYWVSYPAMVELAGGTPVIVNGHYEQQFKITPDQLNEAITPRTKLLFLNSPSNPTGVAYTADELRGLADVLVQHPQVIIATDDIYEYILWGHDRFTTLLNVAPELSERTLVMNGVSKSQCMTGWRIGYTAGPISIVKAMKKIQSHSTSCPNTIAQYAAVTALLAEPEQFSNLRIVFKRRHDLVYNTLKTLPDVRCLPADGTFYCFPDLSAYLPKLGLADDVALAEYLLEQAHIALVPGSAFGAPGYLRFSCATDDAQLERALTQLKQALPK